MERTLLFRRTLAGVLRRFAYRYPRAAALMALVLGIVAAAELRYGCRPAGGLRVATFNIQNYPKGPEQEAGAFQLIRELRAPLVGVQEIRDPIAFAEAARRNLGPAWTLLFPRSGPEQRVALLLDGEQVEVLGVWTRDDTVVNGYTKPLLDAELKTKQGERLRVLVVHLKAGGAEYLDIRRAQLARLQRLVDELQLSGERVVLLGDFNSTTPEDRDGLAALASSSNLTWTSRDLRCTAYWPRETECRSSALDHVFLTGPAPAAEVGGPCQSEGCDVGRSCPVFSNKVSDHCPVVVELGM